MDPNFQLIIDTLRDFHQSLTQRFDHLEQTLSSRFDVLEAACQVFEDGTSCVDDAVRFADSSASLLADTPVHFSASDDIEHIVAVNYVPDALLDAGQKFVIPLSRSSESSCLGSVLESDLACPEQLADDAEATDYSSACDELTPSEPDEEEVLSGPSRSALYSFSPLISSPLTEDDNDDAPSATFSLFLDFAKQFVPCVHPKACAVTSTALDLLTGRRFEDLDDEESYERFRRRERREAVARDYTEVYSSIPDSYGPLVVEQRVVMVNWIIEHSRLMNLQPVTMFMGIGLMDRFLTQGYMKGLSNLQLLGIACITLATHIEENQPFNCVLQKTFTVGINTYSQSEVVAMEWLVQEVLNFKCFVTTTHHFLWFYLKAANADDKVANLANYLAFLSLRNHKQLSFWPSTVAAAVVALACLATGKESSCHLVMETHMRTQDDDLPECLMCLEWLLNYVP